MTPLAEGEDERYTISGKSDNYRIIYMNTALKLSEYALKFGPHNLPLNGKWGLE